MIARAPGYLDREAPVLSYVDVEGQLPQRNWPPGERIANWAGKMRFACYFVGIGNRGRGGGAATGSSSSILASTSA